MPIHLIYARSLDHCIGRDGGLPWRLPADFRHFKRTTLGHPIVMGRKTYGDHQSVLPGRTNVVLSRDPGFRGADGIVVRHDLEAALDEYGAGGRLAFVIGGAGVFSAAFPRAEAVIETIVRTEVPEGDVRVEAFDFAGWRSEKILEHGADERHAFAFEVWERKRP
ncbi:dihydrofolate reductase [Phycisphaera mikurensis]|uniref:dihydrofolate reductase n=1 Tax=Phycisphaera mikurensis (strain NBRC 102666 / KCTC 22515 / FYK2301M01) TaxID=1142394 RepID=I0IE92_PHYMF|nr:dihydrofolate reductase [Phycisphaera mikurensis]MBB6441383.1 dihydrofolate reductase [Phycisphaera mikurensis]BAM03580.1 dihydrofolate reductase [Phycisphaera mikurensis NBRC 102666]